MWKCWPVAEAGYDQPLTYREPAHAAPTKLPFNKVRLFDPLAQGYLRWQVARHQSLRQRSLPTRLGDSRDSTWDLLHVKHVVYHGAMVSSLQFLARAMCFMAVRSLELLAKAGAGSMWSSIFALDFSSQQTQPAWPMISDYGSCGSATSGGPHFPNPGQYQTNHPSNMTAAPVIP